MKDRFGFDWAGIEGTLPWRKPHLSRRMFFRHLTAAVGGYTLLPSRPMETVARGAAPGSMAKNCIFILLNGGASHTDTFDLKEGPWLPAAFRPNSFGGVRLAEGLLPRIAAQMDSVALVRSVRSWAAVHELARNWVQIGRNPVAATSKTAPHIGSVVARELGRNDRILPPFIALNAGDNIPGAGYFPPQNAPFLVNPGGNGLGNTAHRDGQAVFERRFDLLLRLEGEAQPGRLGPGPVEMMQFGESAKGLMYNQDVDRIFSFAATERTRYGNTALGNACIAARNLLQSGLGTRFVMINNGGWDNHANIYGGAFNAGNANSLARQFDTALGTLIADMRASGLLEETLIVCMGEFGRTVGNPNSQGGRDHFLQQAVLFAGAGIRGPKAIGVTDGLGSLTLEPGWNRDRDIRAEDIEATIYSALGIDWMTVLRDDPLGRGFEYVPFSSTQDLYGPIHELWA
jgi:hypothetical protein